MERGRAKSRWRVKRIMILFCYLLLGPQRAQNPHPPSFLSLSRLGGNEVVWKSFLLSSYVHPDDQTQPFLSSFCLSDLVGFLLLTLNRSLLFQLGEFSASCTWLLKRLSLIFGSKQLGFIHVFVNRPFPVYSREQRRQKLSVHLV